MKHLSQYMVGPAQIRKQFFIAMLFGMSGNRAADQMKAVSFFMFLRIDGNPPAVFPFTFGLVLPKLLFIPVVNAAEQFVDPPAPVGINNFSKDPDRIDVPAVNDLECPAVNHMITGFIESHD